MKMGPATFLLCLLLSCTERPDDNFSNDKLPTDNTSDSTSALSRLLREDHSTNSGFDPSSIDTTLVFRDSTVLRLSYSPDSILIREYFMDQKLLDSIDRMHDNSHRRALDIENHLFRTFGDRARRDTSGLSVRLENGEWKLLELDPMTDEADHVFEYYFEDHHFYSIYVQWGEGSGYKLVNSVDGRVTNLFGRPYFSPDGKYVLSVNCDLEAHYSDNGLQLFSNENGTLTRLGSYEPDDWGPFTAKWTGDNTLMIKNRALDFSRNSNYLEFFTEVVLLK